MFTVMSDLKARHSRTAEPVHKGREGSVTFSRKLHRFTVSQEPGAAAHFAVVAFRLEAAKLPGRGAFDVLTPEHCFEFCAAHLSTQTIDFVIGNRAELALHFFRQIDAKFA